MFLSIYSLDMYCAHGAMVSLSSLQLLQDVVYVSVRTAALWSLICLYYV